MFSGRQTHRGKSQNLVAWIAGKRETESLAIDKAIFRMVSKSSGRNESKRKVAPKNIAPMAEPFGAGWRQHGASQTD